VNYHEVNTLDGGSDFNLSTGTLGLESPQPKVGWTPSSARDPPVRLRVRNQTPARLAPLRVSRWNLPEPFRT